MIVEFKTDPQTGESLKKLLDNDGKTIYGFTNDGEFIPIANITKHPDCPDEVFDSFIRALTGFREERK